MFGKIYESTWWGKTLANGFGAIYHSLNSAIGDFGLTERVQALGGFIENLKGLEEFDTTLPEPSILMIPSAYTDGLLLSALPSDGSADIPFTRGSLATRVNAQGLVENVQTISDELVSNGDFSQEGSELVTDGNFTNQAAVDYWSSAATGGVERATKSLENGFMRLTYDIANGSALFRGGIVTSGKSYKVTFRAKGTANSNFQSIGDNNNIPSNPQYVVSNPTLTNDWQNYEFYVLASGTTFRLYLTSAQIGDTLDITNISVKEVGQDWSVYTSGTSTVTFEEGAVLNIDGSNSNIGVYQENVFSNGTNYKIVVNMKATASFNAEIVESQSASTVNIIGNVSLTTSYQEFTFYHQGAGTNDLFIHRLSSASGSNQKIYIKSASIKEITDATDMPRLNHSNFDYQDVLGSEIVVNGSFDTDSNWTKGANWTISGGTANATSTSSGTPISQYVDTGKKYKITYDVVSLSQGAFQIDLSYSGTALGQLVTTTGTFTDIITSINPALSIRVVGTTTGSIDNVSVKEVTGQEVVPDSGEAALLLEDESTNLYDYSEPTANEGTSSGVTYESFNWGIGFTNCVKYGDNSVIRWRYGANVSASTEYTLSAFVIMDDLSEPMIGGNTSDKDFSFVLGGGVVVGVNSSVNMGNNIWRVSVTATSSASPNANNNGILKYTSQSNKGFRVVGFQLEQQSYATSYIPTNGAIATRLADIANNSGNASLINSTEGVFYFNSSTLQDTADRKISLSDGTSTNRIEIVFVGLGNLIYVDIKNSNGLNLGNSTTISSSVSLLNKYAVRWSNNNYSFWVNGVKEIEVLTGNTFNPNSLSTVNLSNYSNSQDFYGKVKALAVYKEALTDAELQSLTTI